MSNQNLEQNKPGQVSSDVKKKLKPAFYRKEKERNSKPSQLVAFDFETTRIKAGTPRPLYLTGFGLDPSFYVETPIHNMQHLHDILEREFLTIEYSGVKYVAWNANNFDNYFVAAALVADPKYTIRPYLTGNKALRGMRVMFTNDLDLDGDLIKGKPSWEFLDGMSMLGFAGLSLSKFLANFASEHEKMTGVIDFEKEEFDPTNKQHCAYAMRDSEGLYYGMVNAQRILLDNFNQPLAVTMGGVCIKIFQAHIPRETRIYAPSEQLEKIIRDQAMRGGFCYCVKRYQGPVWKYDLNQAYAAAMRECKLPAGNCSHSPNGLHKFAVVYVARITAVNSKNKIPFYHTIEVNGRIKSAFSFERIENAWVTSVEHAQLITEGWAVQVHESFVWATHFNMREYVDKLERIRMTCEGGPSGPIGTMVKGVGNHSYGKTLESLEPINYLLSSEPPPGYVPLYDGDDADPVEHVFSKMQHPDDIRAKAYHQPQIGAFITSHVRMVVRRAALKNPDAWLYADTDCVVFSENMTEQLDTDAKRYGAWKIEEEGTPFQIIAKKVYVNLETTKASAKGMNVKRLTLNDFDLWFNGKPPVQQQVQRNNFLRVMQGAEMFKNQQRTGTAV